LFVGTEEQLVLPGYGVEAVLKNMEYSAIDDKKDKAPPADGAAQRPGDAPGDAAEGDAAGEGAPLGEVKGFKLDALLARRPELRQELLTFRDALMAGEDDEAIKVGRGGVFAWAARGCSRLWEGSAGPWWVCG
jgi:UDP-glucose:glycoprotein glucosyltransferase